MVATTVFTLGEGSLNVLLSPHLAAQGLSQTTIGTVVAAFSGAALASRFVAGSVYRTSRARYIVPGGCVLSAVAFLAISVSSNPWVLGALTALNGVGFAFASTGGLAAIMKISGDRSAGSIMGWYTGAIGAGYAVAGFLSGAAGDWLGVSGAIALLALIPALAGIALAVVLRGVGGRARSAGDGSGPTVAAEARAPAKVLRGFRTAGPLVWLAFAVGLHVNLLNGVLNTYFPLYGLAIGLSLTRIGILTGLHASVSSLVRFAAPVIFKWLDHRRVLPWMVVLGGLGVAALTVSPVFSVLAVAWMVIGFSRGILRVASAALVMETSGRSGRERGAASSIYLAGLDIGKIIGPLVGGAIVPVWSYEGAFLVAGLGFPVVYFVLSRAVRRRQIAESEPVRT